jgi:hypothetical protein
VDAASSQVQMPGFKLAGQGSLSPSTLSLPRGANAWRIEGADLITVMGLVNLRLFILQLGDTLV